ncbi:MAG TPA: serine/threonine-protein kinase [Woeseiaceae bacterium]|nr:serine/threonine-protein kinase [Woeseiaceae bacterium]
MGETELTAAERLFAEAVDLDPGERADWLDRRCAGDPLLRRDVDALLAAAESSAAYFEALPARLGIERLRDGPGVVHRGAVGEVYGHYRLVGLLGTGGMGDVWRAERADGRFESDVAVKLLTRPGSGPALARFDREAHYLARLTHPNIARLIDAGVGADGTPFLILEYVDGQPIDAWCDARALGIEARLTLFLRVAEAVAHAHSRLIVHSDIKPSNVLVTGDGTAKLLDFGIASLLEPDQRPGAVTALTPEFAAPEQLAGEGVSTASDVYALGLLLFLLLSGQNARSVNGGTNVAASRADATREPPSLATTLGQSADGNLLARAAERGTSPARLLRSLRGDVDAVVRKALRPDPAERYATVPEFIADLKNYLRREPVSALPATIGYRTRRFVGRHRGGVLSAALTAIVLVAATTVAAWQSVEARRQRDAAIMQQQRVLATNQFLNLLLSEIGPDGEPLTLNQLLDRGVNLLDRQFAPDGPFLAHTLYDVAVLYATIGKVERQLALLDRAEALARERNDTALLGTLLCAKARALHVNDPEAAARHLEEGLAVLESRGQVGGGGPNLQCARARGLALATAGQNEEAAGVFEAALAAAEASEIETPFNRLTLRNDLIEQYLLTGRYDEALAGMDEVIAEHERIGRGNTAAHLVFLANKGAVLARLGEVSAALEPRRRAFERAAGMDEPLPGIGLHYGASLVDLARYDEALRVLEPEYESARLAGNARFAAQSEINIGMALVRSGRYDEGEEYLARAEAFLMKTPEAHARLLAMIDATTAEGRLIRGDVDGARTALAPALARLGYPQGRTANGLLLPLLVAGRIELAAGEPGAATVFADDAVALAESAARDVTSSADVGKALLLRAQARQASGDSATAATDLAAALIALEKGLGPEHPVTREARAFHASLQERP